MEVERGRQGGIEARGECAHGRNMLADRDKVLLGVIVLHLVAVGAGRSGVVERVCWDGVIDTIDPIDTLRVLLCRTAAERATAITMSIDVGPKGSYFRLSMACA